MIKNPQIWEEERKDQWLFLKTVLNMKDNGTIISINLF